MRIPQSAHSTHQILQDKMRGRSLTDFDRRVLSVLHHEIFARREGLRTSEASQLAYRRLRYLNRELGLTISETLGNIDRLLALHQWTSVVDGTLTTLLTIHFNLCIGSILEFGAGGATLVNILKELESMDSIGVFLATELAYGNNVQAMETRADYDHEAQEFRIHTPNRRAQKFMPNTGAEGIAKIAVVMARMYVSDEDCGVFPFVVRIRTPEGTCPGVHVTSLGEKPDYPLDNAITWFDNVRVPREHWLAGAESGIDESGKFHSAIASRRERFLQSMDRVQTGKLCLSVAANAMTAAAAQLTLRYSQQRRTFGPGSHDVPVLAYRTQQRSVIEALAVCYGSSFLLHEATEAAQLRHPDTDLAYHRLLALSKVLVSSRAIETITRCRERVGAQGLFSANRILTYFIHVNGIVTAEGDNEVLLMKAAREMLLGQGYTPPAKESEDGAPSLQSLPDVVRLTRSYERTLHASLRAQIAHEMQSRSRFDVWNESLGATTRLAQIHAARLAMEAFLKGIEETKDPKARLVLERLGLVFALKELAGFAACLMIEGLASPALIGQLDRIRDSTLALLNDDMALLNEALYVPAGLIDAPIGEDFLAAYDCMDRPAVPKESTIYELMPARKRQVS